jgi:recombination protein RecT
MPEKNTFADRLEALRETLAENRAKFTAVAADGVNFDEYTERLIQAIGRNPKLLEATLGSLCQTLLDSVILGLPIGGPSGYGHAVPRKSGKGNNEKVLAQFQAGYLGKLQLAYQSPLVAGVVAREVYPNDDFGLRLGTTPSVDHVPTCGDRGGDATGYYGIISLTSGFALVEYMTRQQVSLHRDKYSKGANRDDSAWKSAFDAMAKKTVLLRVLKWAPAANETARRVLQQEEYDEAGVGLQSGDAAPTHEAESVAKGLLEAPDDPFGPEPEKPADRQVASDGAPSLDELVASGEYEPVAVGDDEIPW